MTAPDPLAKFVEFTRSLPPGSATPVPEHLLTPEVLKYLHGQPPPLTQIWDMRGRASTRDLVIESVGTLELLLTQLLRASTHTDASSRLYGENGKVRDFELKIELAYSIEAIEKQDLQTLNLLRKVRNRFAHDPHLREFQHDRSVISFLQSIPPEQIFPLPVVAIGLRDQFVGAVLRQVVRMETKIRSIEIKAAEPSSTESKE